MAPASLATARRTSTTTPNLLLATMGDLVLLGPRDGGVVTLTLNRPDKKNALSVALRDEMSDLLDVLAADEDVKVVVVTGAGDVFSAGFDLKEFDRAAG